MYDIIGDIHGHAEELKALLAKMGYSRRGEGFAHPTRQVIFVGDFIDRGPQIAKALAIVRAMVDSGAAHAVMGNHEFNAIAFHTPKPGGGHFREQSQKNVHQHEETLRQVRDLPNWVEWFKTLPVALDLGAIRVVHACWDAPAIDLVNRQINALGSFTVDFLIPALANHSSSLFTAVDHVLKGKEVTLPQGMSFVDVVGYRRTEVRTRWFESPKGRTWRNYVMQLEGDFPDDEVPPQTIAAPYPPEAPPVFFGHYWLNAERPEILAPNVCCVDYSVAKGGKLVAYRFDGESALSNEKFALVAAVE